MTSIPKPVERRTASTSSLAFDASRSALVATTRVIPTPKPRVTAATSSNAPTVSLMSSSVSTPRSNALAPRRIG